MDHIISMKEVILMIVGIMTVLSFIIGALGKLYFASKHYATVEDLRDVEVECEGKIEKLENRMTKLESNISDLKASVAQTGVQVAYISKQVDRLENKMDHVLTLMLNERSKPDPEVKKILRSSSNDANA